jgi:hypothetical protein
VTDTTVATMTNVLAGAYVISAKTIIDPNGSGPDWTATCTLDAGGGVTDIAEFQFNPDVSSVNIDHLTTLSMLVTRDFPATGSIVLRCRSSQAANARITKITAVKVDSLTREAVTG